MTPGAVQIEQLPVLVWRRNDEKDSIYSPDHFLRAFALGG